MQRGGGRSWEASGEGDSQVYKTSSQLPLILGHLLLLHYHDGEGRGSEPMVGEGGAWGVGPVG